MYPINNKHCDCYANSFVDLNKMPFMLSEYMDRNHLTVIDRSRVYSEINIDSSEPMRAIIDIHIDDIGRREDGSLSIVGNNTKQRKLLQMIQDNYHKLDHQLPVLKSGIRLCVHYQLENKRTGQMIRSMIENIIIKDRQYYLDTNPNDINDNAIICGFEQSTVSTLSEFTHGCDPLQLRITQIQMYYDVVSAEPVRPTPEQMIGPRPYAPPPGHCMSMSDYHRRMQNQQFIGDYGCEPNDDICPPHWDMFNRLYHFENHGSSIRLHMDEINHPRSRFIEIPCGLINVNRVFLINPGQRVIWKFTIWKNDVTIVNDTRAIATVLKPPCYNHDDCGHMDVAQNNAINQLTNVVTKLAEAVSALQGNPGSTVPDIPPMPTIPDCHPHPCHPHDPIHQLYHEINDIKQDLDNINSSMSQEIPDPLPVDDVDDIMQNAITAVPEDLTEVPDENV